MISRRRFIGRVGAVSGLAAGAFAGGLALWERDHFLPGFQKPEGFVLPDFSVFPDGNLPGLAVARGVRRETAVRAVFDALGGVSRFISNGDIVVLKPNVAFDRAPALNATTHPDTLRAVAMLALAAGARRVVVADNPINSPHGCFLKSGIADVANDLGLEIAYPTERSFDPISIEGDVLRTWDFFAGPFRGATKVIGIAPCKDHNLSHASMTMKNWYGLLGGRRNQFHQHIHRVIADFALMIRPTLVLLDGMNVLVRNGPTGGRLTDVKPMHTIVAGTDMVAVDSYGYTELLERDLAELEYVHRAHERGLGNRDWRDLRFKEVTA
jgi:uncharacterized protein (DUF362 family)